MKKNNKHTSSKKNFLPYNYIWSKENPISYITEGFQKFLVNLEYVNVDKKYKTIQVTSSLTREGKSTFISNVAYLLSQKKNKTILIDLDLRKPKIHRIFDVENINGVTDVLSDRIPLEKAIKKNKKLGFDCITAGDKTTAVVNLLESNRIKEMIENLKKMYDYVLIDSPPVINVSDALYISKLSDAVLFVVSQKEAKRTLAKDAVNLLRQNDVNLLGIVLNHVNLKKNRYGYGYGYGYEYKYE